MSKYTTEVRFICERYAGLSESAGYAEVDSIIDEAIPNIFDFDYPIFDESYRNVLNHKILKHYYTREIGMETVGLWKLKLNTKMNEIMPYFNERYIVAQSWNSSPQKTKSILTELLEVDNINFNITQHIDTVVGDGRTRLIYDIDAYITKDTIKQALADGNINDILYHDMQDQMFDLFVSVASKSYLDSCKK